MNHQTTSHNVNTAHGASVAISTELLNAAYENAHQQRSESLARGFRWMGNQVSSQLSPAHSTKSIKSIKRFMASAAVAVIAIAGVNHARAEVSTAEIVAQFDQRPGGVSQTPDGRILMSIHPLDGPVQKMVEINADGSSTIYPDAAFSDGEDSTLKAVLAIRTDDQGVAWILDFGGNAIYAWDTNAEKLIKTIAIHEDVRVPTSFMQDFALDQKRHRAIIADMTQGDLKSAPTPAFVTVDLETGEAHRIAESHPSMMPEAEGGFALNPITIDPDYEWVYFGALNGRTMYRVPAASFDGDADKVAEQIEIYGTKPFSDGATVDGSGNVYVNDIENNAIGVVTPGDYQIIAKLPEGQSWPDGNAFGLDGYIYVTVNQLSKAPALNEGKDLGEPPYLMVRVKALAAGSAGR